VGVQVSGILYTHILGEGIAGRSGGKTQALLLKLLADVYPDIVKKVIKETLN
jgi:hypothetical protein